MSDGSAGVGSGGGRRRGALWPLFALLLLVLVAAFLLGQKARRPSGEGAAVPEAEEASFTRSAVLYYGAPDGEGLVSERRELILGGPGREEFAVRLLQELARPPEEGGAFAALPEGLVVRGVFFDDLGELYMDLDAASLRDRSWGTSSEILAIRCMVRTLCGAFPEVLRVGVLLDGKSVETLGGHVDATHPFEAADWR
jgi:hypothetical protein